MQRGKNVIIDNGNWIPCLSDTGVGSSDAVNAAETAVTEDTWDDDSDDESSEEHDKNVRLHGLNMNCLHLRTPLRTVQRYHSVFTWLIALGPSKASSSGSGSGSGSSRSRSRRRRRRRRRRHRSSSSSSRSRRSRRGSGSSSKR